jgi:hypothetical protein
MEQRESQMAAGNGSARSRDATSFVGGSHLSNPFIAAAGRKDRDCLSEDPPELERQLRLEVLEAWDAFAKASRESTELAHQSPNGESPGQERLVHERAKGLDMDSFWRYQRVLKRFSDLIVFGEIPDDVERSRSTAGAGRVLVHASGGHS